MATDVDIRRQLAYASLVTVERALRALLRGYREDDEPTYNLVVALFGELDDQMMRLAVDAAKHADGHAETVRTLRRCIAKLIGRLDEIEQKAVDIHRCAQRGNN